MGLCAIISGHHQYPEYAKAKADKVGYGLHQYPACVGCWMGCGLEVDFTNIHPECVASVYGTSKATLAQPSPRTQDYCPAPSDVRAPLTPGPLPCACSQVRDIAAR